MQTVVPINRNELTSQQISQISLRAYALYEARHREDGHDVEDWLKAEAEIAQEMAQNPTMVAESASA